MHRRPVRQSLLWTAACLIAVATATGAASAYEKRFICGESPTVNYTDTYGNMYVGDPTYSVTNGAGRVEGWSYETWKPVGGSPDPALYERTRNAWSEYRFDVPSNGDYLVRLHFVEIVTGPPGSQVFDIAIEGQTVLDDLDVFAEAADEHYALAHTFVTSVADGQLNITGTDVAGVMHIAAIEVFDWAPETTAPAAATGLAALSSYNRINLDWDDNTEPDIAGYWLERSETSGGPYTRLTTEPIPQSRYFDDAVAIGPTYYYQLIAVDAYGNEAPPTAEVSAAVKDDATALLPVYKIAIGTTELHALMSDPHSNVYQPATFTYDGQSWQVGVRFRGGIARSLPKKSWKIKFNEFVPGQRFLDDIEELNLNAYHGERTMMRDVVSYDVLKRVGVPASDAEHVHLQVNDQFYGVFGSIEQVDERWLDRYGYPAGGSLYKSQDDGCLQLMPDSLAYTQAYGKKTNRSTGYDDLIALIELINATPPDSLYHTLAPIFDIEGFFNYYAAQIALSNDSFFCHNFYLYHDLDKDFWYYLPWDLDSTWGHLEVYTEGIVHNGSLIHGVSQNPLILGLQQVPHFRNRNLERALEIINTEMPPAIMDPVIDTFHAKFIEDARLDWYKWGWENNSYVDVGNQTLKSYIPLRTNHMNSTVPLFLQPQDLFLNEIMANNDGIYPDEFQEFDDWFEIVNMGTSPVSLAGHFVTDDITNPTKFALPDTTLAPGGYLLIWADDQTWQGPLHANFRLTATGEFVGLFGPLATGNQPIDTKSWGPQIKDVSFGRYPDGHWDWMLMGTPTPIATNTDTGNLPPVVEATQHQPANVGLNVPVVVTSAPYDLDGAITQADIFYNTGAGWMVAGMADDGLSGDGAAGDGVWGGTIPGQPAAGIVNYYVRAVDSNSAVGTEPVDAPDLTFTYQVGYEPPNLVINEIMAQNLTTIADEWGEFDDWVEIHNPTASPVALGGLTLSDNFSIRGKYTFPDTTIEAGDFLIVWADNDPVQGPYHANFRLSAAGEEIGLYGPAITGHAFIDSLTFNTQMPDTSLGRDPDAAPVWVLFHPATPGASNSATAVGDPQAAPPLVLRLGPVHPSPFHPRLAGVTHIPFTLPADGLVSLRIYDAQGRVVRRLVDGALEAGIHSMRWDGTNQAQARVSSGIYFTRLATAAGVRTAKVVLVR